MPENSLVWVDLETTGFTELNKKSVYTHKILEMAIVITDAEFNQIASLNQVIQHDPAHVISLCDEVVLSMHTGNGLLEEVATSSLSLKEAELNAIRFLDDHGILPRKSPLCGNSIMLDRMYLEAQMSFFNDRLHYRNLDISAVKEFLKIIDPSIEPAKIKAHRAMGDIHESLNEARHYQMLLAPLIKASRLDSAKYQRELSRSIRDTTPGMGY